MKFIRKCYLVDSVEHHVPTWPGLGVEVTLVEDVAVVEVPHQLPGAWGTGEAWGEQRTSTWPDYVMEGLDREGQDK